MRWFAQVNRCAHLFTCLLYLQAVADNLSFRTATNNIRPLCDVSATLAPSYLLTYDPQSTILAAPLAGPCSIRFLYDHVLASRWCRRTRRRMLVSRASERSAGDQLTKTDVRGFGRWTRRLADGWMNERRWDGGAGRQVPAHLPNAK